MYPYIKLLTTLAKANYRPRLKIEDSSVIYQRVGFTDIDIFGELNNARYLNIMEMGRWDYSVRTGFVKLMRERGWGLAVGGVSIRYRRRLPLFQKYTLTSTILCHDGRWIYFLQEAHAKEKICASALIKVCATSRGGLVPATEVSAAMGRPDWGHEIPAWVQAWVDAEGQRPWPES